MVSECFKLYVCGFEWTFRVLMCLMVSEITSITPEIGHNSVATCMQCMKCCSIHHHHHHVTTVLWPFFWDHPDDPVPEENFWILWCKGRLTEADTLTILPIWLGATPSGLTSVHLHRPPYFFADRMPFLPPNQQYQSTEGSAVPYNVRVQMLEVLFVFVRQA